MSRAVLFLVAATLVVAGCSTNTPIGFEQDDIKANAIFVNTDENTHIWIHHVNDEWVNLVLSLDGVPGLHRCQTTINNLTVTLSTHWEFNHFAEPLEPFLDPPPYPDTPLDDHIAGGVILDGSAALVGLFEDERFMEYRGEWIPADDLIAALQMTAYSTVGSFFESMTDVGT